MGLATNSFSGHGDADDVGEWIWMALSTDLAASVQVGILRQIEDLPLFVDGIDRDLTSDITARIVYGPLAEFTAAMVEQCPQFRSAGNTVKTFTRQVWDPGVDRCHASASRRQRHPQDPAGPRSRAFEEPVCHEPGLHP
ncbi:hypothetical protein ABZ894_01775 [Nocardia beijingensis]|uniref:hypothetical protein n=1 Tax=Nocardia beijingensis TaxID=95162 RepID=UPI0033D9C47F